MEETKLLKRKKINKIILSVFGILILGMILLGIFGEKRVKSIELKYPSYRDYPGVTPRLIASDLLEVSDDVTHITVRNDSVMDIHNRTTGHEYDAVVELVKLNGGTRVTISTSSDDSLKPIKLLDAISARIRAQ